MTLQQAIDLIIAMYDNQDLHRHSSRQGELAEAIEVLRGWNRAEVVAYAPATPPTIE